MTQIVFRRHVQNENVGTAVVVEVGDVGAHTRKRGMLEILPDAVAEGAVPVVHVANVIGEEIV